MPYCDTHQAIARLCNLNSNKNSGPPQDPVWFSPPAASHLKLAITGKQIAFHCSLGPSLTITFIMFSILCHFKKEFTSSLDVETYTSPTFETQMWPWMSTIIESIDERNLFLKAHKGTDHEKRHTISAATRSKKTSLGSLANITLMFISSLAMFLDRGQSAQRTEPLDEFRPLVVQHFHLQTEEETYNVTFLPPPALLNLLPKQINIHSHLGDALHSLLERVTITAYPSTLNQGVLWPWVADIPSQQL